MAKISRKLVIGIAAVALMLTTTLWSPPAQAMEPFIGQVQAFGFNFPPRGWAHCDGQLLPISQYSALFSLLGTTFGGDGRTTFGLPDLRGRVAVHPGTGPGLPTVRWGERSGSPTTSIAVSNLPPHNHSAVATAQAYGTNGYGDSELPEANSWARRSRDRDYSTAAPDVAMSAGSVSVTVDVGNTGGGVPINNMQPYLGIYHSIALQGVFPSRS